MAQLTTQSAPGSSRAPAHKPTVLFVVTEDWYFWMHRAPVARMALQEGAHVVVVTRISEHGEAIRKEGFELIPFPWRRRSLNPLTLTAEALRLATIYRRVRPVLVHHVAVRPCLVGSIAALATPRMCVVNNFAGLGSLFSGHNRGLAAVGGIVSRLLRWASQRLQAYFIVENAGDREFVLRELRAPPDHVALIRGIGVDLTRFTFSPEPDGVPVIALIGRMLWPKGVRTFVDAVRILRGQGQQFRALLVGGVDPGSRDSVPEEQLRAWHKEGAVEWLGHQGDIEGVMRQVNVVVNPTTYAEGLPRVLLEAAACGRAVVASDIPGCREFVQDQETGLLIAPGDAAACAAAVQQLIQHPQERRRLAENARCRVENGFSEENVLEETRALYRRLLAAAGSDCS